MPNLAEVNGRQEIIEQSRWNFRKGAAFTKVMPGGGVASDFDPLEVISLTLDEMKAAVDAAKAGIIDGSVSVHDYRSDNSCPVS